nr:cytochrome P450 [Pharsalia antennata]
MSYILLAAAVVLLVTYIINQVRKPANFPPGPSWLPFIGNLPELRKLSRALGGQYLALIELAKRYKTNVLGLKLGSEYVVTVFSYPVIKTVLLGDEYDGRPDNFFMRLRTMGTRRGITCTDGELWKIQRNFVVTHLRSLGFGKKPMEILIKEEIPELLGVLQQNGSSVRIGKVIAPSVINILWALTTGSRIDRKDPRLNRLLDLLELRKNVFDMSGGTLSQHPWLRFVAPERTGYNVIQKLNVELKDLLMETVTQHYKTWTAGASDDLIHSFITEMKNANGHETTFTEEQLVMVCLDIFIAGAQTTSTTLDFAFLVMILYPDVQSKVHACLDQAFKKSEDVNYSDRVRVPYIEAVLLEVERYYHVTPITGPRRVLRDTTLEGYSIPKGTTVLISSYSIHHDKDFWGDPEVFRPDRFLDENGKLLSNERLIPFGLGRRRCLGEILAKHCLFIFFVELMRRYKLSSLPGMAKPSAIPLPGITLSPEKYTAKFTSR